MFKAFVMTVSDWTFILFKCRATSAVVVPESRMMVSPGCTNSAAALPILIFSSLHRDEKIRIGRAAAELVQPGETIILDSGTTTAEVARHLKRIKIQSLTVITNALNIAAELSDTPDITLIMIGGLLRPVACSFVGPQAEAMMSEFHADRLFLAVDGFDLEN